VQEWKSDPATSEQAMLFREAVFVAISWTERRHSFLFEAPWSWASSIDDRLDPVRKQRPFRVAQQSHHCKLEPYFEKPIVDYVGRDNFAQRMCEDLWPDFLTAWSRRVLLTMGMGECRHAWNKQHGDPNMTFTHGNAKYVNREAQMITSIEKDHISLVRDFQNHHSD